jgi:hypothetical protein
MSGNTTTAGIPAAAAAVGYTTETFGPAVTLGNNWAPFNYSGINPSSIQATQNADGSVTIQDSGNNWGAQLASSEAFGGGGYFEATMSFPATANTGGGAFWMNDFENMVEGNPGSNWVEVDAAEFDNTNNTTAQDLYQIQYHNWVAPVGSGKQNLGVPNGIYAHVPAGTDWTKPHRYGLLWVPATATTQGYLKFYFDGALVGISTPWSQGAAALSVIDSRHLALILGTGGSPTTVYNVQVWGLSGILCEGS